MYTVNMVHHLYSEHGTSFIVMVTLTVGLFSLPLPPTLVVFFTPTALGVLGVLAAAFAGAGDLAALGDLGDLGDLAAFTGDCLVASIITVSGFRSLRKGKK